MSPAQRAEHKTILIVLSLSILLSLGAMAVAAACGPPPNTPHPHETRTAQFAPHPSHKGRHTRPNPWMVRATSWVISAATRLTSSALAEVPITRAEPAILIL